MRSAAKLVGFAAGECCGECEGSQVPVDLSLSLFLPLPGSREAVVGKGFELFFCRPRDQLFAFLSEPACEPATKAVFAGSDAVLDSWGDRNWPGRAWERDLSGLAIVTGMRIRGGEGGRMSRTRASVLPYG